MSEALQSSRILEEKRTAELEKANESLQNEIGEHRRAEEEISRMNEVLELKVEERTRQLIEAQEKLVGKEKLSMLGLIAGNIGNELRNPLGVMNNAVFFLKNVMSDANETVREYLDIIAHEIDNSQRIIYDFVEFTLNKTPKMELMSVPELVQQGLGRCIIPKSVQMLTDLPEKFPKVLVDPHQMGKVLQHLATNAVQAMPHGGTLRVAARFVGAAPRGCPEEGDHMGSPLQDPGDFIEISVADTGVGIAPEHMVKIFQPLFSTRSRGIGLGLPLAKNLTEANGGRLEVKSELGNGTTFSVILPAEKPAAMSYLASEL